MKKYLIFLIIFLGSLFFTGNVKAAYTDLVKLESGNNKCGLTFTDEDIENIKTAWGVPSSIDSYLLNCYQWHSQVNSVALYLYNSEDVLNKKIYISTRNEGLSFNSSSNKSNEIYYYSVSVSTNGNYNLSNFTNKKPNINGSSGSLSTVIGNKDYDANTYILTNQNIYDYVNNSWFESNSIKEPSYTYEIINPSDNKWQINFNFENMSNNYYYKIIDTSNDEVLFTTESNTEYWSYDVFYNKILKIKLYDKENNYISGEEIDITGIYYQENTKYSVIIKHNPRHDNGNSYNYTYYTSIKDLLGNMSWNGVSCYHGSINGQVTSWYEDDCSSTDLTITSRANEILQWKIVVGDKIVYKRQFSVVNDLVSPYIIFDIKENYNGYNVSIIGKNMIDGQYITYKIDDETTEKQITNGEIIPIFNNSRIYAYIWNTNNDIDSIMKYFKNISNSNNSLLTQFGKFWTNFRKSNLYLPIMISFVGSIILCIIKLLKR